MYTSQYTDLFFIYCEGLIMNTGNKNPIVIDEDLLFSQQSMYSPLVLDYVKNKYYFPLLNDSNSFGTVDKDAHMNAKIDSSINLVFKSDTS